MDQTPGSCGQAPHFQIWKPTRADSEYLPKRELSTDYIISSQNNMSPRLTLPARCQDKLSLHSIIYWYEYLIFDVCNTSVPDMQILIRAHVGIGVRAV